MCQSIKPCKNCSNTYHHVNSDSVECTNCMLVSKRTTRQSKSFMVTATSDFPYDGMLVLTVEGWVCISNPDNKTIYHKRKGKNLQHFISNPPYGYTVEITEL